jgi:biopolymer transport protein ExbD
MDAGGGKKGAVKADINVTPLVDIVLVLLIIFIVITPAVNDAVRLPMSKHSVKPEKEQGAKYLTLMLPSNRDKDGKVIGAKPVIVDDKDAKDARGNAIQFRTDNQAERDKLVGYIKTSVSYLNDKRVFVKADADLPFKFVNELFQICREGGADEASVVTSEDKSKDKEKEGGK